MKTQEIMETARDLLDDNGSEVKKQGNDDMKVKSTINGVETEIALFAGKNKENHATIKAAVESTGIPWVESDIFIADFPERGRYIIKQPGYSSLGAGG